jgi:hypothetical protein
MQRIQECVPKQRLGTRKRDKKAVLDFKSPLGDLGAH